MKIAMVQTVHDLQMLCPNHMMLNIQKVEPCELCVGTRNKLFCVKQKCIHNSLCKSIIGAIEGSIYETNHVYEKIGKYICPSYFIESKLLEEKRYQGKTIVLHNFLNKTDAYFVQEKKNYILYFGRLSEEKGIERMLKAFERMPDIHFIIAGSGPLEELCYSCKLQNVEFVGFKTGKELEQLVAEALFTLHLSVWYENCPMAILESQSFGTPVLCNRIGGMPELVEQGETGILIDEFTPEAYERHIRKLYKNRQLLTYMSEKCLEKKQIMMNLDDYCDSILKVYETEVEKLRRV